MPATKKGKQSKKIVAAEEQFRTEYKDRVLFMNHNAAGSATTSIVANTGSVADGPTNTTVFVPSVYNDTFARGQKNGEVEGNWIMPKYLNMKISMDFSTMLVNQPYVVDIYHGWCKDTLERSLLYEQIDGGRNRPAFAVGENINHLNETLVQKFLFNAKYDAHFLTYTRKGRGVKILSRKRITGKQMELLVAGSGGSSAVHSQHAPVQNFNFNWKLNDRKLELYPLKVGDGGTDNAVAFAPAKTWVPFVAISVQGMVATTAPGPKVQTNSKFVYTDV
jgi:hypothetical protein